MLSAGEQVLVYFLHFFLYRGLVRTNLWQLQTAGMQKSTLHLEAKHNTGGAPARLASRLRGDVVVTPVGAVHSHRPPCVPAPPLLRASRSGCGSVSPLSVLTAVVSLPRAAFISSRRVPDVSGARLCGVAPLPSSICACRDGHANGGGAGASFDGRAVCGGPGADPDGRASGGGAAAPSGMSRGSVFLL